MMLKKRIPKEEIPKIIELYKTKSSASGRHQKRQKNPHAKQYRLGIRFARLLQLCDTGDKD